MSTSLAAQCPLFIRREPWRMTWSVMYSRAYSSHKSR